MELLSRARAYVSIFARLIKRWNTPSPAPFLLPFPLPQRTEPKLNFQTQPSPFPFLNDCYTG